MYYVIGVSAPSLHRESTDSLIIYVDLAYVGILDRGTGGYAL